MPSAIPVGAAQATFVFTHTTAPKDVVCTLGLSLIDYTGTELEAANKAFDAWADTILPGQATRCALDHVDLFIGNDRNPSGSVRSDKPPEAGNTTGDKLAANSALLVNKRSNFLSRSGRGRMFVPYALSEGDVDEGGKLNPGAITAWGNQFAAFFAALEAEGASGNGPLHPVILSNDDGVGGLSAPRRITTFQIAPVIGTRGSRLR